jgi:hypothetical protein
VLLAALITGCFDVGSVEDDDTLAADGPAVDCSGLKEWARDTFYPIGARVTDTGDAFVSQMTHTSFGIDWNPKRAHALWKAVGPCAGAGGGGGGGEQQPPPPAEEEEAGDDDGAQQPPPPADGCSADGAPGPRFDPAGVPNVGNGEGEQFIGGQCLSSADCASACCAFPCGICSGPGAQFQAGKQGCGFGD